MHTHACVHAHVCAHRAVTRRAGHAARSAACSAACSTAACSLTCSAPQPRVPRHAAQLYIGCTQQRMHAHACSTHAQRPASLRRAPTQVGEEVLGHLQQRLAGTEEGTTSATGATQDTRATRVCLACSSHVPAACADLTLAFELLLLLEGQRAGEHRGGVAEAVLDLVLLRLRVAAGEGTPRSPPVSPPLTLTEVLHHPQRGGGMG